MPIFSFSDQKAFADLTDREVLALAIQNEEEDARIFQEFAGRLRDDYPASSAMFRGDGGRRSTSTAGSCSTPSSNVSATIYR